MSDPRTPRQFCGDNYPWRSLSELREGERIVGCYLVHTRQLRETRQKKPFLTLTLGDGSGTVEAVLWDGVERFERFCVVDAVIGVRARVGAYRDRTQLTLEAVEPVDPEPDDTARLLPSAPRPVEEMSRRLDALIASVRDPGLSKVLRRCLGADTETGRAFRHHPAAKQNHHAYLGGLLEHSVSLADVCDRLAEHYRREGAEVDRDLLVAGALLHDIGKLHEIRNMGSFAYTDAGNLIGHIVQGVQLVGRVAEAVPELPEPRRTLLLHLITSHQGRLEWGSPSVPKTVEALILHSADNLDAKINTAVRVLEETEPGEWTGYARPLERRLLRTHPPTSEPERGDASDGSMDLFGAPPNPEP